MRNFITASFLLMSFASIAQGNEGTAVLEKIEVVETPGTAAELYRKAERWMVDAFRDSKEAIDLRDTATHTLVAKGYRTLHYGVGKGITATYGTVPFTFTLEVSCKDGRYRSRIYNAQYNTWPVELKDTCYVAGPLETGPKSSRMIAVEMRDQFCTQIMATVRDLQASLKAAMLKPKDDW
jgi:hypothetical protein